MTAILPYLRLDDKWVSSSEVKGVGGKEVSLGCLGDDKIVRSYQTPMAQPSLRGSEPAVSALVDGCIKIACPPPNS